MEPETWNLEHRVAMLLVAVLAVAGLAACDEVSGPEPNGGPAPVLSSFSFTPTQVSFEELPPEQIISDTAARIPIELSVHAEDPDGCVRRVGYVIAAGLDSRGLQVTGDLPARDAETGACVNGWFEGTAVIELSRGAVGPYTVRVFSVGQNGRLGDQMQGQFHFALARGKPPVVESVEASADTIRPPAELQFVATVSDPDGLSNIQLAWVLTPGGDRREMFDDGQTQGDQAANDGKYTVRFDVPEAEPGEGVFSFWAEDKNGLVSDTLEKTVVVAE